MRTHLSHIDGFESVVVREVEDALYDGPCQSRVTHVSRRGFFH